MKKFFLLDVNNRELSDIIGFLESNQVALILDTRIITKYEDVKLPPNIKKSDKIYIDKIDTHHLSLMINKYKECYYYKDDIEHIYHKKEEGAVRGYSEYFRLLNRFIGNTTNEWEIWHKSLQYKKLISIHRLQDKYDCVKRERTDNIIFEEDEDFDENFNDDDEDFVGFLEYKSQLIEQRPAQKTNDYDGFLPYHYMLDYLRDEIYSLNQDFHNEDFYFSKKFAKDDYVSLKSEWDGRQCGYQDNKHWEYEEEDDDYYENDFERSKNILRNYEGANVSICIFYDSQEYNRHRDEARTAREVAGFVDVGKEKEYKIYDEIIKICRDCYSSNEMFMKFYDYNKNCLGYEAEEMFSTSFHNSLSDKTNNKIMSIYFVNPIFINNCSWNPLLKILNIEHIIDLNTYKPTDIYNALVSDKKFEKNSITNYLPQNYTDLSLEEKKKIKMRPMIWKLFSPLVAKSIRKYKKYKEEEDIFSKRIITSGVLVLCSLENQSNIIDYCARYFCSSIYFKYEKERKCIDYIQIIKLDFLNSNGLSYDKDSYSPKWLQLSKYDNKAKKIKCELMDEIFYKLFCDFSVSKDDFFKQEIYEKIIKNQQANNQSAIERNQKGEDELWQISMAEMERENAKGELQSWDEDFPGWNAD